MSEGSDDPNDSQYQPQASPDPNPSSSPFAPQPSTTPIATSSTQGTPPAPTSSDPTQPPADFARMVRVAIAGRLGGLTSSKFLSIPAATLDALINKIWQDPTVQQYYNSNHQLLNDPQLAATFEGQMAVLINQTIGGQGNDPTVTIDYSNMLTAAGVQLTTAEQQALATAQSASNAAVPRPFNENVVSGYSFNPNQMIRGYPQLGTDYGTTAGERIVSPFAGTVKVETGVGGYGNYVTVTLDNGWVIGFGHVAQGFANGQRVNPGDLIAIAGANIGDSTGSVTIVTVQNAQGKYVDPKELLDPIFSGTTFTQLGFQRAAGQGYPSVNKALDQEYPGIKSEWTSLFGTPPSPEDVLNVVAHGDSPKQWSDYMMSLPSRLPGLTMGTYTGIRSLADARSNSLFGFDATDGIVQELNAQGFTDANGVKLWYDQNSPPDGASDEFKSAAKASSQVTTNVLNDPGIDPRHISNVIQRAHQQHEGLTQS